MSNNPVSEIVQAIEAIIQASRYVLIKIFLAVAMAEDVALISTGF